MSAVMDTTEIVRKRKILGTIEKLTVNQKETKSNMETVTIMVPGGVKTNGVENEPEELAVADCLNDILDKLETDKTDENDKEVEVPPEDNSNAENGVHLN